MVKQITEDSNFREDQDSEDKESEDNKGYKIADMSEPWSNTSDCSNWSVPTYPKIFYKKGAETAVIKHWTFEIRRVDAVVNCLIALNPNALKETPINGLHGTWDLYSLDHRLNTLDEGSFYHRLIFTDNAVKGRLPNRERMMKRPLITSSSSGWLAMNRETLFHFDFRLILLSRLFPLIWWRGKVKTSPRKLCF